MHYWNLKFSISNWKFFVCILSLFLIDFEKGGAALFTNSNFTIDSSLFLNNTAKNGAGLYISWVLNPVCITSVLNSEFTMNSAISSGGGIMYDLYRPTLSGLVFDSNYAQYGVNIASYAIKIRLSNSTENIINIKDVASGKASESFTFQLEDYDNQTMNLDSSSKITIKSTTSTAQAIGKNIAVVSQGITEITGLIFISPPGSRNVKFSVNSNSINMNIAKAVYDSKYTLPFILADFRYWKPGEYIFQNQWVSCSQGSFSLEWNSTQWEACMNNAVCEGDNVISVNSGYWRKNINSTLIVEWPNKDACAGGYNTNYYLIIKSLRTEIITNL